MSWQATDAVWQLDRGRDFSAKMVLLALAWRSDTDGTAWPRIGRMATDTGLGRSTVRRAIGRLSSAGLVEVIHTPGRVSRYRLTPPAAGAVTPPAADAPPARSGRTPRPQRARNREQVIEHVIEQGPTPPQQPHRAAAASAGNRGAVVLNIHRPDGGTNGDRADEWAGVDCQVCGGTGWVWVSDREVDRCRAH